MTQSIWFVSDLHLSEKTPALTQAFITFLQQRAQDAHSIYLLGDIFDYWIGDDYHLPRYAPVIEQLQRLHQLGIQLYFMAGNRDFLAGSAFMQASGCRMLDDPHLLLIGEQKVLLLHGDTLCTDDVDYQRLRQQLRDASWQHVFLAKPISARLQIAEQLRQHSQQATSQKNAEIMDVNQAEVERVMALHDVKLMIHGHTHRPQQHQWQLNNQQYNRIVLGDWGHTLWALQANDHEFNLQRWQLIGD
jgi:UDP-2,3-diacylglucosamine hydrolase